MTTAAVRQTRYVAPRSLETPVTGDIVLWDGHQWDVVGTLALAPPDEAGYRPLSLRLERIERPNGRKKVVSATADSRDVVILGHQAQLPGLPQPPEPERPADQG